MSKVSILMPVYNAEQFLAEAISSIIEQDFKDWELIVINDGSTDHSESIIAQYDDQRIRYVRNDTNLKLIKTLNKGIDLCTGKYIARMDADDVSLPERLGLQVDYLDTHPECLMCGTNASVINNRGDKTGKIRNLSDNEFLQINLLFSPPFIHPSMMIRREVLLKNRYDEAYKHVEDYELWCRISKQGEIGNIDKELLKYRWHDTNVSVLNNQEQERSKNNIIIDELHRNLGLNPTAEELYCHKITFQLYSLGHKLNVSVSQSVAISNWFSKLIAQNKLKNRYNHSALISFLWSRWIVLCLSQKKYGKIFSPQFASYKPSSFSAIIYSLNRPHKGTD